MKLPLPKWALPTAISAGVLIVVLIVWAIVANRNSDNRLWPDVNNGVHDELETPLATGHYLLAVSLQEIDAPADALRRLGFQPDVQQLGSDENSGSAYTRRIMDAVAKGRLKSVNDVTLTGPNAMTFILTYPGDPNNPFASSSYQPQVVQTPEEPLLNLQQPGGVAWSLLITPHLLTDGRFYCASQITTTSVGTPPLNSLTPSNQPILLASIPEQQLVSVDGKVVDTKEQGVHLVIGTIRLVRKE